jgi:hypothetical protein
VAYFGSPFLTLHEMRRAAERKDAAALSAHIEFPALRGSANHAVDAKIARKLAAKQRKNGAAFWAGVLVSSLARDAIDKLVTPEGVAGLLGAGAGEAEDAARGARHKRSPPEFGFAYEGLDVFLVDIRQVGLPGDGVTLVMRRGGLVEWKLVGVRL